MKKLKLYLDTSVIGYLDEKTSPKEMSETLALWQKIKDGKYDVIVSRITLDEINDIKNIKKINILLSYLSEITFNIIEFNDEVLRIAELVKNSGLLVSDKHRNDRFHIGFAIVSGANVLVSMNFRHLTNVRTIESVRGITISEGYGYIEIMPPIMLIEGVE
ncbi:MAG: PIN domain-containing protein [Oscillospiraceae bacterium]|jgi:predicted nucleic acid-binding protein|nr:PIN domain-containing protein [Oscillospiraceae bacterium]